MEAVNWEFWDREACQPRPDCGCVSSQDVPYPVEAVVQAGGYVVHQVTATDHLKTGDQVQLHLDEVGTNTAPERPDGSCVKQSFWLLPPTRSTDWPAW